MSEEKDLKEAISEKTSVDEPDDLDVNLDEENIDYAEFYAEEKEKIKDAKGRKRRVPKRAFIIAGTALILLITTAFLIALAKNWPNSDVRDVYDYFGVDKNADNGILIYNYEKNDSKVLFDGGMFYLNSDFVEKELTDKFYYDEKKDELLYTDADSITRVKLNESSYSVNDTQNTTDYVIAKKEDEQLYIAVEFLKGKAAFTYQVYEEPLRLCIYSDGFEYNTVTLSSRAIVRDQDSVKGRVFVKEKDEPDLEWMLTGVDCKKHWVEVMTDDGRRGYVFAGQCKVNITKVGKNSEYTPKEYTSQVRDHDIFLVWHAVYSKEDNDKLPELMKNSKGVNVVSPTWYKVTDAQGSLSSMVDWEYIRYVHDNGMEIWPLVNDFLSSDEENGWDEKELLSSSENRNALVNNIIKEIKTYNFDGINIDFEKVPKDAGADFVQFVRELSIACRREEVVLSIDNYVPMSHTEHYGRKAQGECVDYVIVMGYDEHYNGSEEAGSVASLPFVEYGMDETLKYVPKEKVINGIPFYTRIWADGKDESGNRIFTSKSCSMQEAYERVEELGLNITWDEDAGQNKAEGTKDGIFYSVWLEDAASMKLRMEAVRKRDIAGVAAWCLGFETDDIWDVINE